MAGWPSRLGPQRAWPRPAVQPNGPAGPADRLLSFSLLFPAQPAGEDGGWSGGQPARGGADAGWSGEPAGGARLRRCGAASAGQREEMRTRCGLVEAGWSGEPAGGRADMKQAARGSTGVGMRGQAGTARGRGRPGAWARQLATAREVQPTRRGQESDRRAGAGDDQRERRRAADGTHGGRDARPWGHAQTEGRLARRCVNWDTQAEWSGDEACGCPTPTRCWHTWWGDRAWGGEQGWHADVVAGAKQARKEAHASVQRA